MTEVLTGEIERPGQEILDAIPDDLKFDVDERLPHAERPEADRLPFALGNRTFIAYKPLDYTMLTMSAAVSGMASMEDRAYAIMLFCHDVFDAETRNAVRVLGTERLFDLIIRLCQKWGEDTSDWEAEPTNRATRRATKPAAKKRR